MFQNNNISFRRTKLDFKVNYLKFIPNNKLIYSYSTKSKF